MTEKAADVATNIKDVARSAANSAGEQAHHLATQAKDAASEKIADVAGALRNAASDMKGGSVAERTLGQIADGIADASESLQGKDIGQMIRSASDLARRNPVIFVGGAVLIGFAAARLLKASAQDTGSMTEGEGLA
ncbi:MAG: hypothetical protein HC844_02340 [Tabrizicola sp.]|nr:hypothetical protein [Tabrizicola sp.]